MLFMWPNDANGAISRNSETRTFFSRALAFINLTLFPRAHSIFNFSALSLLILFIWPNDATGAILRNSETQTFFPHGLALIDLPLLPRVLHFEFSRAIASNIIYLA